MGQLPPVNSWVRLGWPLRLSTMCSSDISDLKKVAFLLRPRSVPRCSRRRLASRAGGRKWRRRAVTCAIRPYGIMLLMLCGDVPSNPGPRNWKHPCGLCSKPVMRNQEGIQYDLRRCDWGQPTIYFAIGDHVNVSWCRSHTNASGVMAT